MAKETTKKTPKKTTKKTSAKTAAAKNTAKKAEAKAAAAKATAVAKKAPNPETGAETTASAAAVTAENKAASPKQQAASKRARSQAGPSSKLKKWNYWLAALYAAQAIAIVALGNKTAVPVTVQYPSVDTLASEAAGHEVVAGAFRQLFSVELGWLVATFLIVFATLRYMAGRKTRVQDQPGTDLAAPATRWMNFGLGGGLILTTIALLSGIYEVGTLLLLFVSMVVSCALGFGAEVVIDKNKGMWTRLARGMGNLAVTGVVASWIVLALAAVGAVMWDGRAPVYLYSIYGCVALLFIGTMLATYFYFARQGRWADPLYAERSFMMLEFLTASYLAWQIFAGVLHA